MVLKLDKGPQNRTAYRVHTDRLVLRCWSPEDAPALRRALDACDAHLRPMIPFMKDEPQILTANGPVAKRTPRRVRPGADVSLCGI